MVNTTYHTIHRMTDSVIHWYNRYEKSDYLTSCKNWHDSCKYPYRRLSVRIS